MWIRSEVEPHDTTCKRSDHKHGGHFSFSMHILPLLLIPRVRLFTLPPPLLSYSGIGGNLVSIQSSRISTNLHLNYSAGEVPEDRMRCYSPCRIFFGSGKDQKAKTFT